MSRLPLAWLPVVIAFVLLAACNRLEPWRRTDALVVAVLDDPVFYQSAPTPEQASGFDHDLIRAFADHLKLKVRFVTARSPAELNKLMADGIARFACAMPIQPTTEYRYVQPLREAQLLLVQHADQIPLNKPADLPGHVIAVSADGPAQRLLADNPVASDLTVRSSDANGIDLLAQVEAQQVELVATDSAHLDIASNFYPDLTVAQELPGKAAYSCAFRPDDEAMRAQAEAFITEFKQTGRMARLEDRYFGHINRINADGVARFIADMHSKLPAFRADFENAQALTGLDWRLIAALAYQESKWNPLATSFTNVRGIMMLTEETADRLHVGNRLDPKEAILAGARYLSDLIDELPDDIKNPDRKWFGLAAYNLGMGHLRGARQIAAGMRRDTTSWYEMKKVLPLMARPEYYERLKAGRARGGEAVILVENVRTYYDILSRFEPAAHMPLATGLSMQ